MQIEKFESVLQKFLCTVFSTLGNIVQCTRFYMRYKCMYVFEIAGLGVAADKKGKSSGSG